MLEVLRRVTIFEGLNESKLSVLSAAVVARAYPKNAIIASEGDRSDTLFLILSGPLRSHCRLRAPHRLRRDRHRHQSRRRLCATAPLGDILVDRKTLAVVEDIASAEEIGTMEPPGFCRPVPVARIVSLK